MANIVATADVACHITAWPEDKDICADGNEREQLSARKALERILTLNRAASVEIDEPYEAGYENDIASDYTALVAKGVVSRGRPCRTD
ncbi:hypothetical protein MPLA_1800111 [Mesorhizobium sp. ORS 3359]|nr:hypothetical protein MPLA_1800111 [Mesorhizobium sp. ORS 3359]